MKPPTIVITQGTKLKLDPSQVKCTVLTDDLCVLFVDFSPRYKEVEAAGHMGDQRGQLFRLLETSSDFNIGDDDCMVSLEGGDWGPNDKDDCWFIATDAWKANTSFYIAFYRYSQGDKAPQLEVKTDEWED